MSSDASEPDRQIDHLKAASAALAAPVLARYTELAGSGIVNALRSDMNDVAKANEWQILISAEGFRDTHAFETPEAAARAYSVLIRAILTHMTDIIGGRLAGAIFREAAQQLEPAHAALIQTYHLVPAAVWAGKTK